MKTLSSIRCEGSYTWDTHLGCIKGCLNFLGLRASMPWVAGATGYAFVICVSRDLCPSALYACMEGRSDGHPVGCSNVLMDLCGNLGCRIDAVIAWPDEPDRDEKKRLAWEKVKVAVDRKRPCYGYGLGLPGYQVISGYDQAGYIVGDAGEMHQAWDGLDGFEVYVARKAQPADDRRTVSAGVEFVLEHSRSPSEWTESDQYGLAAYDNWVEGIQTLRDAHPERNSAISAAYSLYRSLAVAFLKEAKPGLGAGVERILDEAIRHYETVRVNLREVAACAHLLTDRTIVTRTVTCLRAAQAAEAKGLKTLQELAYAL